MSPLIKFMKSNFELYKNKISCFQKNIYILQIIQIEYCVQRYYRKKNLLKIVRKLNVFLYH